MADKTYNWEYCKRVAQTLENENFDLYEYLDENVLDIQYIVDYNKEFKDVRLYVTIGGPTVWIDTESCSVRLSWGTETSSYGMDWNVCDMIRYEMEQLYNC